MGRGRARARAHGAARSGARPALVHRRAAQLRREPAALPRRARGDRVLGRARAGSASDVRASCTHEVARAAAALRAEGVGIGDRVAGFLPNGAEAVIAMLATASIGAVWSCCSPDFGATGVLDRFGQIEPGVLFAPTATASTARRSTRSSAVREVAAQLPSMRARGDGADAAQRRTISVRRCTCDDARFVDVELVRRARPPAPTRRRALRAHSRSIIRSTSCTRRARRGCRSASCTAQAARCCSTSRSSCCTPTCGATTASSTSPPAGG